MSVSEGKRAGCPGPSLRARCARVGSPSPVIPRRPPSGWLPALVVPGSEVTVTDIYLGAQRAGFLDVLQRMGGRVEVLERTGERAPIVQPQHGRSSAPMVRRAEIPSLDEVPVLAVAAAVAEGQTRFRDVGELRVKESDRLAGTVALLRAFGADGRGGRRRPGGGGRRPLRAGRVDARATTAWPWPPPSPGLACPSRRRHHHRWMGPVGHELSGLRGSTSRAWPRAARAGDGGCQPEERPDHRHRRSGRGRAIHRLAAPSPGGSASTGSTRAPCTGRWPGPRWLVSIDPDDDRRGRPTSPKPAHRGGAAGPGRRDRHHRGHPGARRSTGRSRSWRPTPTCGRCSWRGSAGGWPNTAAGWSRAGTSARSCSPHADLKIFLTASPNERARRRSEEGPEAWPGGTGSTAPGPSSPLEVADGAHVIDTTGRISGRGRRGGPGWL